MSDTEISSTPPEIQELAKVAGENLLPDKSKHRYEREYNTYKSWCISKNAKKYSENVLLAYFGELSKVKKPSTLWATYSMLKTTLNIYEKLDISNYAKLTAFLKKQNVGYSPKKSNIFTKQEIDMFIDQATTDFLPQKVALIIGISGACRSDELFKMKMENIDCLEDKIIIAIPNTKTYNPRSFVITDQKWIDIVKYYINMRGANVKNEKLFMQIRSNKITNQPFGHNSIAQFPKKIALCLQLKNASGFTGHCFRRTAATLLANSGCDVLQLKRMGGWKSSSVAEGYVDSSLEGQLKISNMLSSQAEGKGYGTTFSVSSNSSSSSRDVQIETHKDKLLVTINAQDNSNVTINFNK